MVIRLAAAADYAVLAEMKWLHAQEDAEIDLSLADKAAFIEEFVRFLKQGHGYRTFVAEEEGRILSAMYLNIIRKTPKPCGQSQSIAYLTSVFTLKEYRNKGIGAALLKHIKEYATQNGCELMFVWPSERSANWYRRNDFSAENDIHQCVLMDE